MSRGSIALPIVLWSLISIGMAVSIFYRILNRIQDVIIHLLLAPFAACYFDMFDISFKSYISNHSSVRTQLDHKMR